jgi:hypothetical protein
MGQGKDVPILEGDPFSYRFQKTSAGKMLQVIAQEKAVGILTGETLAGHSSMKKAVAAQAGEVIQIRRGSGLQRGPVVQFLVGSIAEAIKEDEDDLHQEPRFMD